VKHKLERGEPVVTVAGIFNPDLVEFFGGMGFDGVWFEGEHGPVEFRDLPDLSRACDLWGMTSIARVNLNLPGVIYRSFDHGVQGIAVPHVDTVDDARAVVHASKFRPMGMRGMASNRQGIGVDRHEFFDKANDETLVIILIEHVDSLDYLDDYLKIEGIDVFFVPGGDLSQSMDRPTGHPDVVRVMEETNARIVAAGRNAGGVALDADVEMYLEQGVRFLMAPWQQWASAGAEAFLRTVADAG